MDMHSLQGSSNAVSAFPLIVLVDDCLPPCKVSATLSADAYHFQAMISSHFMFLNFLGAHLCTDAIEILC